MGLGIWDSLSARAWSGVLFLAAASLLPALCAGAEGEAGKDAEGRHALLRRLIATLPAEPLLAVYTEDAPALPAKFSRTCLSAMLQDPTYAESADKLRTMLNQAAGADLGALWPGFNKLILGPAVLAVEPTEKAAVTQSSGSSRDAEGRAATAEDSDLKLVLLVVTPSEESAQQLLALWPKPPPQSNTLLSALRLQPVALERLEQAAGLPPWLTTPAWPRGDLCVRALPAKTAMALGPWIESGAEQAAGWGILMRMLGSPYCGATAYLGLSLTMSGEMFLEEAQLDLARPLPAQEAKEAEGRGAATLWRTTEVLREHPGGWENVLSALPGGHDLVLLARLDPRALGPDLPFAAQALERNLRGRRWARGQGGTEEALAPRRFEFLLKHLEGSVGLAARPALSGEMRVSVATGLSTPAAEMGAFQNQLLEGLAQVGAEFEPLGVPGKDGAPAPLGAKFRGGGMFRAPIVGLSPGWAWLCSNSAAYQELVNAFKLGRTLAAENVRENKTLQAAGKTNSWRDDDAARLQVELEKVAKLAYASWLFSGESSFGLGPWKIPAVLLPQPQALNNRLGVLRTGLCRQGHTLRAHASSWFPGAALILPYLIYEAADTIDNSRRFSREALEEEQVEPQGPQMNNAAPPPAPGKAP
ncbi:MAG: hypothetical protein ABSE73_17890 [Planctomycetota bacterium]